MPARRFTVKLPVIPEPAPNTRAVFIKAPEGGLTPFIRGSGPATLICGNCALPLVKGVDAGQINHIVFKCPQCGSYNDVPYVPALEQVVAELLAADNPAATAEKLKKTVEAARDSGMPQGQVVEAVHAHSEALAALVKLLVPESAGDFYSMLGCVITFLAFIVTLRQGSTPSVVVNQFIQSQTPPGGVSRKAPCPCGSGKKFKHCHGRG